MAYKALYRTYRPIRFDEVVGQKHIIKILKNAVSEKRISHAYVFSGLRGIGKTTIARIFAKSVNCELTKDGEPCNVCRNCLSIINEETTDVVELDAASNNGVDQMRDILEKVNFLPSTLNKKVYIIDEAHMLSTAAFNALLKTLEEPPAHVIFILATTEPYKIPTTILSRCQRLDFKQLTTHEIIEMLTRVVEKENIKITDEALRAIAETAEGAMRDALSILDQARVYNFNEITLQDIDSITGRVSYFHLIELIKALNEQDTKKVLDKVNSLMNSGKEVGRIVTCLIQFCRDLLLYKSLNGEGQYQYIFEKEEFKSLAYEMSDTKLFYYVDMFVDIQNKIRFTNSPKIYLEVGMIKIINSATLDVDLITQIQKLEEKIELMDPSEGSNSLRELFTKIDTIENKVKKVTTDIEKMELQAFKENILSKVSALEDLSTSHKGVPLDVQEQIQEISDTLNELQEGLNQEVVPSSVQNPEYDTKLQELENKLNQNEDFKQLEARVQQLESKEKESVVTIATEDSIQKSLEILENKIHALELSKVETPQTRLDEEELKEKVANVEEYMDMVIHRVDELARSMKNTSSIPNINGASKGEMDELNENYLVLIRNVQSLQEKVNQSSPQEEAFSKLETKINEQWNHALAECKAEIDNKDKGVHAQMAELKESMEALSNQNWNQMLDETKSEIDGVKEYSIQLSTKVQELKDKFNEINTKLDGGMTKRRSPFEIIKEEKAEVKEEVKPEKKEMVISKTDNHTVMTNENTVVIRSSMKNETLENVTMDETSRVYDAKIVERILHQARDQKCREEKISLLSNWSKLEDRVGHLLAPTAKLLASGTLTANGHEELLIVYPHASMCNQLMDPKGHTNALQILKITFGKDYDFIALPENTWQEKRMEYAGQYNMGIKYPRLTPIKNPELKVVVINSANLISKKNQPIRQAQNFFGEEIVEKEEE